MVPVVIIAAFTARPSAWGPLSTGCCTTKGLQGGVRTKNKLKMFVILGKFFFFNHYIEYCIAMSKAFLYTIQLLINYRINYLITASTYSILNQR
jgi:hypothetical protein